MDRATRAELVQTVESQNERIQRYQKKLADLVGAYKGLLKEKEALEASVQALSCQQSVDSEQAVNDHHDGHSEQSKDDVDNSDKETFQDPLNVAGKPADPSQTDVLKLKEQLATLANSLSTVSQEKSKMEANYQAEKRNLKKEFEERIEQLETTADKYMNEWKTSTEQVQELKSRIRSHQHEREKEQTDHVLQLKELQLLVSKERQQLEQLKESLKKKEDEAVLREEYEKKVHTLSGELEIVRQRLKESDVKAQTPSPLLLDLQKEMAEMKAQNRIAVQLEQKRANEAEDRMKNIGEQGEERVSSLETKLSELSEVVGNYERLRFQDQSNIQKLKERVMQLDMENTALARAAHSSVVDGNDDSNLDVQGLIEKMTQLKGLLKLANERSEKPVDIEEIMRQQDEETEDHIHKRCHEEYEQLKEEFERYKLRAQSVLKNKNSKDPTPSKEMESLKTQVAELKDKLRANMANNDDEGQRNKRTVEDLRRTISKLQDSHKVELLSAETDCKQKTTQLELQIRRQRERTVALLAEKDREIETLKSRDPYPHAEHDYGVYSSSRSRSLTPEKDEESVSDILSKPPGGASVQGEGQQLLYFAQEQARRDVEIQHLRKAKHQVETAMRELQQNSIIKEEKYTEEIDDLKEEIRKLERNKSRESANLEYLKNVVYQYMVCIDTLGKEQMLNAIATILQFSPREKQDVHHHITSWWGYVYHQGPKSKHKPRK